MSSQELKNSVKRLLDYHGQTVTFRRVTEGAYNPNTGSTSAGSTDDESATVVFTHFNATLMDGTNVTTGDRKVLMSPMTPDNTGTLTKVPTPQDKIVGQDEIVTVVEAKKLINEGVVIAYVLHVRE